MNCTLFTHFNICFNIHSIVVISKMIVKENYYEILNHHCLVLVGRRFHVVRMRLSVSILVKLINYHIFLYKQRFGVNVVSKRAYLENYSNNSDSEVSFNITHNTRKYLPEISYFDEVQYEFMSFVHLRQIMYHSYSQVIHLLNALILKMKVMKVKVVNKKQYIILTYHYITIKIQ